MSTRNYNAIQRGKLVKIADKDSVLVYLSMNPAKKSAEFVTGPTTVGTATGYTFTEGTQTFQEVLRTAKNPFFPSVETIYLNADSIELAANPSYDPAKDTDRPKEDATTGPVGGDDIDGDASPDVSTVPGAGRVPVVGSDGKTVYVLVKEPATKTTAQTIASVATGSDPNRKWLTYGLYGVLALAAIALVVIVTRKPKTQKLLPA